MCKCPNCGSTAQVKHLTGGAWMCGCGQLFWYEESNTPAPSTLQEEVKALYLKICAELPRNNLFDDDFENAFQALSEIIEYHGGGKHFNYLYGDDYDDESED